MADTLGQVDVRGIDIQKLATGFADEDFVFKNFVTKATTNAREIRWYQKTSGVLNSTNTTGITASQIVGSAFGTLPPIAEQSATRLTSYVKHFAVESPWFSYADIRDTDPDMFAMNVRDLTRAIANQVDYRILDVLSGSAPLSGSATAAWSGASAKPFLDLLSGSTEIRKKGYKTDNLVAWLHPEDFKNAVNYFVDTAGSSIPQFSSDKVVDGVITKIANVGIAVSNNCTQGQVMMVVPNTCATWKSFTPLTAVTKEEPQIGTKIRVAEDGEILFTNPNAAYLLTGV